MKASLFRPHSIKSYAILFPLVIWAVFAAHITVLSAPTLENGRIAFTSLRDGNEEIYSMNPDGSDQRRLTFDPGIDDYAAWSPDGKWIAYLGSMFGQFAIKVMRRDGTGQALVKTIVFNLGTSNFCGERFSLSWSPDGRKIAFQEFGDIFTINVDGTALQNITNTAIRESEPSWAADGTIAFASTLWGGDLINGLDIKTSTGQYFAWYGYYTCSVSPTWSPDGNYIGYIHSYDFPPPGFIVTERTAGGSGGYMIQNLLIKRLRWSPDGNRFLFENCPTFDTCRIETSDTTGADRIVLPVGTNPSWGRMVTGFNSPPNFDFDGDGRSDISIFRPSDTTWYIDRSTAGFAATQFGLPTDTITPGDYDGDGKTDISVFRDGVWYWLKSTDQSVQILQFGLPNDVPVPAEYTGFGGYQPAVYRAGQWWILNLSNQQVSVVNFGLPGDKPVPADYDGDGVVDQAVYRSGEWHLRRSTLGYTVINFGLASDKPVVGDYDGDGRADPAVYRNGTWYLQRSLLGFSTFQYGLPTDIPTPGDYDGDSGTDPAVYRDGVWYILQSTAGPMVRRFGISNDKPVPSTYLP